MILRSFRFRSLLTSTRLTYSLSIFFDRFRPLLLFFADGWSDNWLRSNFLIPSFRRRGLRNLRWEIFKWKQFNSSLHVGIFRHLTNLHSSLTGLIFRCKSRRYLQRRLLRFQIWQQFGFSNFKGLQTVRHNYFARMTWWLFFRRLCNLRERKDRRWVFRRRWPINFWQTSLSLSLSLIYDGKHQRFLTHHFCDSLPNILLASSNASVLN